MIGTLYPAQKNNGYTMFSLIERTIILKVIHLLFPERDPLEY